MLNANCVDFANCARQEVIGFREIRIISAICIVILLGDKADRCAGCLGVVDALFAAEGCELGETVAWVDVIEDAVDGVFAGYVLDLASAEVKLLA